MGLLRSAFVAVLLLPIVALSARAEIAIREVTSPGGVRAWLVEDHSIPFSAVEFRFRGGTSLDRPEARGAVNLMTGLIEEGTGDMDAQAFAAARDALAARISFDSGRDAVTVSARFLTENRDQGVALLAQALAAPRFDADAIERVRQQVLSSLAQDEKDPETLAARAFDAAAWGDHPYGAPSEGTLDSVAALTRDDLVAAHRATIARDRVFVAAAGDITAEDLGLLIDRVLAGLPDTGAPLPPQADWQAAGGVTVVDFPTPQATVLFGQEGIARDDPDFFAAFLINEIMGGGRFSARLMTEVREKRGLTYGIGTYLVNYDGGDALLGQFASANATVAQAIEVVRAEWRRIATEGVTPEELEAVKTYQTGSYPLRFEGNAQIAQILVGMQDLGLPIDYVANRNAYVEAVTLEDIRRVAARLWREADLHFVVAGQPEGL